MMELQELLDDLNIEDKNTLFVNNIVKFSVTDYVGDGDKHNPRADDLLNWEQAIIFFSDGTAKIVSVDQAEEYAKSLALHGVSVNIEEQNADFITENYKNYKTGKLATAKKIERKQDDPVIQEEDSNNVVDDSKKIEKDLIKPRKKIKIPENETEDKSSGSKLKTFFRGLSTVIVYPVGFVFKRIDNICNRLNKRFHSKVDVEAAKKVKREERKKAKGLKKISGFFVNTFNKFTAYCVDRVYGDKDETISIDDIEVDNDLDQEVKETEQTVNQEKIDVDSKKEKVNPEMIHLNNEEQTKNNDDNNIQDDDLDNIDLEELMMMFNEKANDKQNAEAELGDWFSNYFATGETENVNVTRTHV